MEEISKEINQVPTIFMTGLADPLSVLRMGMNCLFHKFKVGENS